MISVKKVCVKHPLKILIIISYTMQIKKSKSSNKGKIIDDNGSKVLVHATNAKIVHVDNYYVYLKLTSQLVKQITQLEDELVEKIEETDNSLVFNSTFVYKGKFGRVLRVVSDIDEEIDIEMLYDLTLYFKNVIYQDNDVICNVEIVKIAQSECSVSHQNYSESDGSDGSDGSEGIVEPTIDDMSDMCSEYLSKLSVIAEKVESLKSAFSTCKSIESYSLAVNDFENLYSS